MLDHRDLKGLAKEGWILDLKICQDSRTLITAAS